MRVSNNIIAGLLVLAIVANVVNLFAPQDAGSGITGMISTGKANVSVQATTSVTFVTGYNATYFGQGTPETSSLLTISTVQNNSNGFYNGSHCNGTTYGSGTHITPLCIYNDGTDDTTTVSVHASEAAGTNPWLDCGGATCDQTPTAEFREYDNSSGACASGAASSWTTLGTSDATLCSSFGMEEYMELALKLGIPSNMEGGVEHSTTITLTVS